MRTRGLAILGFISALILVLTVGLTPDLLILAQRSGFASALNLSAHADVTDDSDQVAASEGAELITSALENQARARLNTLQQTGAVQDQSATENSDASTAEQRKTQELLGELAKYEQKLLGKSNAAPAEPAAGEETGSVHRVKKDFYVSTADPQSSARLAEALKENETLKLQHEAFIKEISKLRSVLSKARQIQELYLDEREKSGRVEKELAALNRGKPEQSPELLEIRSQLKTVEQQFKAAEQTKREQEEELVNLKRQLSRMVEEAKVCEERAAKVSELDTVKAGYQELNDKFSNKETELKTCSEQLQVKADLLNNVPELKKQLITTKNALLLKEVENTVLSKGAPKESLKALAKIKAAQREARTAENAASQQSAPGGAAAPAPAAPTGSDVALVEVLGEKVNLRVGPGMEQGIVMEVQRGTRLMVEAQQGEWYRVIAPNGTRAYISSDVVRRVGGGGQAAAQPAADQPPIITPKAADLSPPGQPPARAQQEPLEAFGEVNLSSRPGGKDAEGRARRLLENIRNRASSPIESIPDSEVVVPR